MNGSGMSNSKSGLHTKSEPHIKDCLSPRPTRKPNF